MHRKHDRYAMFFERTENRRRKLMINVMQMSDVRPPFVQELLDFSPRFKRPKQPSYAYESLPQRGIILVIPDIAHEIFTENMREILFMNHAEDTHFVSAFFQKVSDIKHVTLCPSPGIKKFIDF